MKRRGIDKPKMIPTICKKCGFRAAADPALAHQIQETMRAQEQAGAILWEVMGRAMYDAHGACPAFHYEKPLKGWCDGNHSDCTKEKIGDSKHPAWKCWSNYLAAQMTPGGLYDLNRIEKELRDEREKNAK